jgi:hypothetical protein
MVFLGGEPRTNAMGRLLAITRSLSTDIYLLNSC